MQFELTSAYIDQLKEAIETQNNSFITSKMDELYPADIAEILNQLSIKNASYVYELLDANTSPQVLMELDEEQRVAILASFSAKEIAVELDNLESDDAADVIAELPEKIQSEVLSQLEDIEQASDIAELINYEEGTAGSLMAKELVSVYSFETVSECIDEIRKQADSIDSMYAIYVVDENDKLIGMLPLKKLLISHPLAKVAEIY
jgi:magnesium transporter